MSARINMHRMIHSWMVCQHGRVIVKAPIDVVPIKQWIATRGEFIRNRDAACRVCNLLDKERLG